MSHIRRAARQNKTMLMKTGSYYLIHICVAALVAYAVTGNLWASLTLSLLEPTVQARYGIAQQQSSPSGRLNKLTTRSTTMYAIPLRSRTATGLAFQRWLVQRLAGLAHTN
eukprot:gene8230-8054_t